VGVGVRTDRWTPENWEANLKFAEDRPQNGPHALCSKLVPVQMCTGSSDGLGEYQYRCTVAVRTVGTYL
jgi:hypothetical protein